MGERICGNGLCIEELDIIMALKKIGVNKASSYDGMTDIIFQKKEYKKIRIRGFKPNWDDDPAIINQHADNVM